MIQVKPEADYDCVYVELVDETSRVRVHLHAMPGTVLQYRELRQLEVVSNADTVFAQDRVERDERLPCDPIGIGGYNDHSRDDNEALHESKHDEGGDAT